MMKETLSYFPIKMWPLVGLGLFLVMFVALLFWVYRQGADAIYDRASHLPLNEDNQESTGSPL